MDFDAIIEAAQAGEADKLKGLVSALVQSAITEEVKGLKAKNEELLGKLSDTKPLRDLGNPDDIRKALDEKKALEQRLEALELGVDDEKLSKLAQERADKQVAQIKAELSAQIEAERKAKAEVEEALNKSRADLDDYDARTTLMGAAGDDLWPSTKDDLFRRVRRYIAKGDDGKWVARDPESGVPIIGRNGTPMEPKEILEDLREGRGEKPWGDGRPFFKSFGGGSGARGAAGGGGGSIRPEDVSNMDMDEYKRRRAAKEIA